MYARGKQVRGRREARQQGVLIMGSCFELEVVTIQACPYRGAIYALTSLMPLVPSSRRNPSPAPLPRPMQPQESFTVPHRPRTQPRCVAPSEGGSHTLRVLNPARPSQSMKTPLMRAPTGETTRSSKHTRKTPNGEPNKIPQSYA